MDIINSAAILVDEWLGKDREEGFLLESDVTVINLGFCQQLLTKTKQESGYLHLKYSSDHAKWAYTDGCNNSTES